MFHRIRILHYQFEDFVNKKPLSIKKINDCADWIYEYIKTCDFIKTQTNNEKMLDKEKEHKYLLEEALLIFGIKHKLFEIGDGQGKHQSRYTTEDVRNVLGKWFETYFIAMINLLTYSLVNTYKDKIKDKYKIYLINKKYGIQKSDIDDIERVSFIYYD